VKKQPDAIEGIEPKQERGVKGGIGTINLAVGRAAVTEQRVNEFWIPRKLNQQRSGALLP
jgi:hypothetical protein